MREFDGDEIDDDGELDTMAEPALAGVRINAMIDAYLDATDPEGGESDVSEFRASALAKPAPQPEAPVNITPADLAHFGEHCRQRCAESEAASTPKPTGLASLIRITGSSPAPAPKQDRATAAKPTGLASAIRFAGGVTPAPEADDDDGDESEPLQRFIRIPGN